MRIELVADREKLRQSDSQQDKEDHQALERAYFVFSAMRTLLEKSGGSGPHRGGRREAHGCGCTIDGILELEEGKLRVTLIKAVVKATLRARELLFEK